MADKEAALAVRKAATTLQFTGTHVLRDSSLGQVSERSQARSERHEVTEEADVSRSMSHANIEFDKEESEVIRMQHRKSSLDPESEAVTLSHKQLFGTPNDRQLADLQDSKKDSR